MNRFRISISSRQKTCVRGKHEIGDRKLEVKIPRPDGAEARHTGTVLPSRQIHLGNVTADITAEDLKEHFGQFGPIDNVIIPKPGPVCANILGSSVHLQSIFILKGNNITLPFVIIIR